MTSKRKRGRPKGARNEATIVREVGQMLTTITVGGKEVRVTVAEAMLLLLERKAMTGDVRADRALTKLRSRLTPEDDNANFGILLVPEPPDESEWIRRAEILNEFREPLEMAEPPTGSKLEGLPMSRPSGSGPPLRPRPPGNPPWPNMSGRLIR